MPRMRPSIPLTPFLEPPWGEAPTTKKGIAASEGVGAGRSNLLRSAGGARGEMGLTYDQTYFIVTLSCYILTAALLWRSWVMKPFRLWTTFAHEFSHACAAWLCCHTVTGIEVNINEGGLTHWQGRNVECAKHLVLPAGYLGSTVRGRAWWWLPAKKIVKRRGSNWL